MTLADTILSDCNPDMSWEKAVRKEQLVLSACIAMVFSAVFCTDVHACLRLRGRCKSSRVQPLDDLGVCPVGYVRASCDNGYWAYRPWPMQADGCVWFTWIGQECMPYTGPRPCVCDPCATAKRVWMVCDRTQHIWRLPHDG